MSNNIRTFTMADNLLLHEPWIIEEPYGNVHEDAPVIELSSSFASSNATDDICLRDDTDIAAIHVGPCRLRHDSNSRGDHQIE